MSVTHIYNQSQTFHLSRPKVDTIIQTEGTDCIFYWLRGDLQDTFNCRYGAFASFVINNPQEISLYLNVDAELLSLIIQYLQTGQLIVPYEECNSLASLASMMGLGTMITKINCIAEQQLSPFKNVVRNAVTRGVNKEVATEIIDRFFEDHRDVLIPAGRILERLGLLFHELCVSTEVEHLD